MVLMWYRELTVYVLHQDQAESDAQSSSDSVIDGKSDAHVLCNPYR
jgi:hypothetical protein